jgi:hypothetical protein
MSASSEPELKKRKVTRATKRVVLVDDMHMSATHMQALVKSSKCNLVPLVSAHDKTSPVLVQLSGGGKIPLSFGIDDNEIDGRRKVRLALQVDSKSDHEHLDRLRDELGTMAVNKWPTWYPDTKAPSDELLRTLCNTFVSARKKKTNSEDTWAGVTKAVLDPDECANGRCKIVDKDTNEVVAFETLPGMNWHKVILEFRYVYIQGTKSYGVTRKLRYLSCSSNDDDGDIMPI